jgi:hypothetical protein
MVDRIKSIRRYKFRYIFVATVCSVLICLIGITGCSNTEENIVLASYQEIPQNPPIELSISQLYDDYATDPMAADDKYNRKRLCIYEVEVEEVGYSGSSKRYFIADNVKFVLRSASKMQKVEPGNILNLVGECRGLENSPSQVVFIKDCWAEGVNCDLGENEAFNTY